MTFIEREKPDRERAPSDFYKMSRITVATVALANGRASDKKGGPEPASKRVDEVKLITAVSWAEFAAWSFRE